LYTNHSEAFFKAKRPVLLNSKNEIVEHDDLVTRSLFIDNLPIVNDSTQVRDGERGTRLKSQVYAEFEQQRPFLLGALYTAVAQGLRNKGSVDLSHLSRMTKASAFAMAALPALGVSREEFLRAYELNQTRGKHPQARKTHLYWMRFSASWRSSGRHLTSPVIGKAPHLT
jgi:hypothetical protein